MTAGPTFGDRKQLARYVRELNRLSDNRPAVAAFIDAPSANPANDHLSVNSLELEPVKKIAAYYRARMQPMDGKVAICLHRIHEYREAAKEAGVSLIYNEDRACWEFHDLNGGLQQAYLHRPVTGDLKSPSHCGVEFARVIESHRVAKFARRLVRQRFHEY